MAAQTDLRISNMDASVALPRKNGELVFDAPWEARAFGLAVTLNERGAYPWGDFSHGLADEIAAAEAAGAPSTYYERWLMTLEKLVIDRGLVSHAELDAMIVQQAQLAAHEHDHEHDHHHPHDHDHGHHHSHNGAHC